MKKDEPLFLIDRQPDPLEVKVRLVCGALFGLLVAMGIWFRVGPFGTWVSIVLFIGCAVVCAALALRHGDQFWERVFHLDR